MFVVLTRDVLCWDKGEWGNPRDGFHREMWSPARPDFEAIRVQFVRIDWGDDGRRDWLALCPVDIFL